MAAPARATRLPGPPELLPGRPDAVVDLRTRDGLALVHGEWRYSDTQVVEIDFVEVGEDLGPSGSPNRTYDLVPRAGDVDVDDSAWQVLQPEDTERRKSTGRVCFNWYRICVTIPERVGLMDPTGSTVVFEVVIDDYAEVWVNGRLPLALGDAGGHVVGGFNTPNRVVLTDSARPGQRFQIAVFGINGPISASPRNYIWMRTASLDFYASERARPAEPARLDVVRVHDDIDTVVPDDAQLERVASGFESTEGPVWIPDGGLLFSSPNTNVIYRWAPHGQVTVFRAKSGYSGLDIGAFARPGASGLTFGPDGLLAICEHGNRRVIRINPRGDIAVLADRYDGRRLNSPHDLVYRSDGTLYFTDPPFGLPGSYGDPGKELPFSGVYRVKDGQVTLLTAELAGPNGIAFSPDEHYLYVANWDPRHKVVMRYRVDAADDLGPGEVFCDMTDAPGEDAAGGLKVDQGGNVYVCGPSGIWVLTREGKHLGILRLPESPHNLAWGGEDRRTLYVTALTSIYRIRLRIPGIRPL